MTKIFEKDSMVNKGVLTYMEMLGTLYPFNYTTCKDEYLAGRTTAWLGVCLSWTPVYLISGADAAKVLTRTCTNRDFSLMKVGQSKHALICNEKGHLIADGVIMKEEGEKYRTYWMAPCITYYVECAKAEGLDISGEFVSDEYFFQIDGPKSLEILEEATQTDLHDLKFGMNKVVPIVGTSMKVQRLGMSGALAYEVHGDVSYAEEVYSKLREVLDAYGGKPQGIGNYGYVNHTIAGYPNQMQHYLFPYGECDPNLGNMMEQSGMSMLPSGSAADKPETFYVNPYEIGWGHLVNMDHEFMGKEALMQIKKSPQRQVCSLEWDADDVADVFSSQFRGTDIEPYDEIHEHCDLDLLKWTLHGDFVKADDKIIGYTTGRAYAYYEKRMVSLGFIDPKYINEGDEVIVVWGSQGHPVKEIRAKVARFPYYQGDWRNETCDVDKLVPKKY